MDIALNPFISAQIPYWSAFLAGLFGGVHCAGMCGGVLGALTFGLPEDIRARGTSLFPFVVAYNLGRVSTYAALGAAIGALGAYAGDAAASYGAWNWLRVAAGLIMIAMGLYLAGWWFGLRHVERWGGFIWSRLEPIRRQVMPVRSVPQAYLFGVVWGFLPCGLVYTLLIWALAAGGPLEGMGFLLAFGMGTLPLLVLLGVGFGAAARWLQSTAVRRIAGITVMGFGGWTLWAALLHGPNVGLGCVPPG
ncbi:MAG: sulfite exporter TauE/SafE family protein [Gammaproteobacteria bacterium]